MRWTPFGMAMHAGDHFADRPDADGMMYYAYVFNRADFSRDRDVRRADLERLVRAVREDDRLLCYEQLNEPAWSRAHPSQPQGSPEGMAEGSAVIRELDPHHPIRIGHMCSNLVATLRRYNPACDIV